MRILKIGLVITSLCSVHGHLEVDGVQSNSSRIVAGLYP